MHGLYTRLKSLEKDLSNDNDALQWFNMLPAAPPTPQTSEIPATPLPAGASFLFHFKLFLNTQLDYSDAVMHLFKGQWCLLHNI
jgi:hypothetical protein